MSVRNRYAALNWTEVWFLCEADATLTKAAVEVTYIQSICCSSAGCLLWDYHTTHLHVTHEDTNKNLGFEASCKTQNNSKKTLTAFCKDLTGYQVHPGRFLQRLPSPEVLVVAFDR